MRKDKTYISFPNYRVSHPILRFFLILLTLQTPQKEERERALKKKRGRLEANLLKVMIQEKYPWIETKSDTIQEQIDP